MSSIDIIWRGNSSRYAVLTALATYFFRKAIMWRHAARTRKQLAELPDNALADIGLTRDMALREAERPFWDSHTMPWKHLR